MKHSVKYVRHASVATAGLLAIALGLVGCGSSQPGSSGAPSTPVGSSGGASASGAGASGVNGAAAAAAYLAAADAAKLANVALDKQYSGSLTFAESKAYYRAAAAVDAAFLGSVRAITFPEDAAAAAAALVTQVTADEALDQQVAASTTLADTRATIQGRAADLKSVAAAGNQLRADLGLPALP